MVTRPVSQDDFARLEHERLAAHRSYNEALTAVDRALPGVTPPLPPPVGSLPIH